MNAALRAAIARLAGSPPERARLGQVGRARVLERFTMARVAADTAAVYRALVPGTPAEWPPRLNGL